MTTLYAGLSQKIITPPPGIHLMGYGNRIQGNIGVHDDLYVTTLVLSDGEARAALLTADHTFIHNRIVDQIKARLAETSQISPESIFVCCSHSHAGPIGYADQDSRPEDRTYIQQLVDQCVASVIEADADIQPVHMHGGRDLAHININRREETPAGTIIIGNNPDGPVDPTVQTLQLMTLAGDVLATLVNYSCHPVVMGPLNRRVSADWVGAMRRVVEDVIGGYCLFFQGATGDINPRQMRWTDDNWDEVEEQGGDVAAAVLRACQNASPLTAETLSAMQARVWLKLLSTNGFDERIREFMPEIKTIEEFHTTRQRQFPWQVELDSREDGVYTPLAVGALRVGDWALASLGTEPFCETGLAIKANASAAMTFVAGYTNGCNSYLPVASAYETGGYEVEIAPLFYGLPAGYTSASEAVVRQAVFDLLHGS